MEVVLLLMEVVVVVVVMVVDVDVAGTAALPLVFSVSDAEVTLVVALPALAGGSVAGSLAGLADGCDGVSESDEVAKGEEVEDSVAMELCSAVEVGDDEETCSTRVLSEAVAVNKPSSGLLISCGGLGPHGRGDPSPLPLGQDDEDAGGGTVCPGGMGDCCGSGLGGGSVGPPPPSSRRWDEGFTGSTRLMIPLPTPDKGNRQRV